MCKDTLHTHVYIHIQRMYKQAFNKNYNCIPLNTLNTTVLLKAEQGMQKVEQVFHSK